MTLAHVQTLDGRADADPLEHERVLVERAQQGPDGLGILYERYCPMLLNYVYRRTGDVHVTEDLVADVFLVVMRSLPGYRYRGIPFRSWLLRIATNTVNRWARRNRRRTWLSLDGEQAATPVDRSTQSAALDEQVQRALLSLPPRYQAVLALRCMEGLSIRETAVIIGCREGTVRSRLARARDALRNTLEGRR